MAKATFAAGCFWGIEETFRRVKGVTDARVGYIGGKPENPTYQQVCGGDTGHAEAVELDYDPETVSYDELLDVFWQIHDPTQLNRQGPDIGDQYRSAIFTHDEAQAEAARASLEAEQSKGRHRGQIVTRIEPAPVFWPAEEYHQQYFAKQRGGGGGLRGLFGHR